jgi:predicted phage gp36 major capsid-like protein
MGGPSEREHMEKMGKIREKIIKTEREINDSFMKLEKVKLEALKKTEEMRESVSKDLEKIERDIAKSGDLASESKERLRSEIATLKNEASQKYTSLKGRLSESIAPK